VGTQIRMHAPARSMAIPPRGQPAFLPGRSLTHALHSASVRPTLAGEREDSQSGMDVQRTALNRGSGHDFSRVSILGNRSLSREITDSKISASGTTSISIEYAPTSKDKSTKIVFIQVMRESLDGIQSKPSALNPAFSYQDADTTAAFFHVDYVSGEKDPYYNGDDPQDSGTQGNATASPAVKATMSDAPTMSDAAYPTGSKLKLWEFRTASFSAAGADQGTFYDYIDWTFSKEKGKTPTLKIGSTGTGSPGKDFLDALDLWDKNHAFTLPKPAAAPPPKPAPVPAPAPGVFPPSPPPPGPKP